MGGRAQHPRRDAAPGVSRRERQGKPVSLGKGKSRLVRGLSKRGRGILRKFLLGGLRPLDLELVEQKRRAGYTEPDRLRAILDRRRGSGGNEIAAQRTGIESSEDAAANQFLMPVFGPDAIEEPGFEPEPQAC